MMSLVAYGSSDESEDEVENVSTPASTPVLTVLPVTSENVNEIRDKSPIIPKPSSSKSSEGHLDHGCAGTSDSLHLSSKLPAPKHHSTPSLSLTVKETKSGARKGPVRILIPALTDFPEDDDKPRPKKKIQPSAKGSGLFALLPPPQQVPMKEPNRSLVPNVVARKSVPPPIVKKPVKAAPNLTSAKKKRKPSESDSGEDSCDADFFSLNKEDEITVPATETLITATAGTSMFESSSQSSSYTNQQEQQYDIVDSDQRQVVDHYPDTSHQADQDYIPVTTENLELDDEAIRQLCGRQGKRRREEVQIVDVSGDALMPDQREWLTKQLTEEQPRRSSKSKFFGPSSQQRRKHQITYLAHVAKENELELKNTWANNRQTRKQTQSNSRRSSRRRTSEQSETM